MVPSTQHFVISIDEGDSQGVYCAYCGAKIVPTKDEDSGSFIFHCECADALRERSLYEQKATAEQDLEQFLTAKSDTMQINELRTRIVVYEQHIHEMKKMLQVLMNRAAGVVEQEGVSQLKVNLNTLSKPLVPEQEIEEVPDDIEITVYSPPHYDPHMMTDDDEPFPPFPEEEYLQEESCQDAPMVSAESSSIDLNEIEDLCDEPAEGFEELESVDEAIEEVSLTPRLDDWKIPLVEDDDLFSADLPDFDKL